MISDAMRARAEAKTDRLRKEAQESEAQQEIDREVNKQKRAVRSFRCKSHLFIMAPLHRERARQLQLERLAKGRAKQKAKREIRASKAQETAVVVDRILKRGRFWKDRYHQHKPNSWQSKDGVWRQFLWGAYW